MDCAFVCLVSCWLLVGCVLPVHCALFLFRLHTLLAVYTHSIAKVAAAAAVPAAVDVGR